MESLLEKILIQASWSRSGSDDILKRGSSRLGRIHADHPHICQGKEFVGWATVAVLKHSGSSKIDYVLRDIFNITPI